ncbi:glycosyltransferase, family 11 domain protein [Leptospira yanagawae serovar Saopaulo str. Sao Paulo = ATCC 700523]|uniref:Glycosyltransferase, family 11 domain protein n=1 Tax=Leptospira yanagawae serovar Saopaulo str. Sao Paulo = ATCC 700523 TaxID=1249483 RepID=A0A5E8HBQ8_9LEPT|nr:alpha-1,2-fucosyltransferase [Leptospira yanagawae]EOQ88282.1 glycosyltransferase, family 11 domain protein [Leptospira yanagawae serovar Saopaulo str. Sao Paulo = ATCC 700523]
MVVSKIYGGLGNQLFQYFFGQIYANVVNSDLYLDIDWFDRKEDEFKVVDETPRKFLLDKFDFKINYLDSSLLKRERAFFYRALKKIGLRKGIIPVNEEKLFKPQEFDYQSNALINGYWQVSSYFLPYKDRISRQLKLKTEIDFPKNLLELVLSEETICIHIRRGDYVTNEKVLGVHGICSDQYFQAGVQLIRSQKSIKNVVFFSDSSIFESESILNLEGVGVTNVRDYNFQDYEELNLMRYAKNLIISNSSFSWWAAFTNFSLNPLVIAPSPWFEDPISNNILLNDWIRLKKR